MTSGCRTGWGSGCLAGCETTGPGAPPIAASSAATLPSSTSSRLLVFIALPKPMNPPTTPPNRAPKTKPPAPNAIAPSTPPTSAPMNHIAPPLR